MYPATPTLAITTDSPAENPCGVVVVIVTVVPDSVAPFGEAAIATVDTNALLIEAGPITVNVAVFEVAPAPLSLELITPLVFGHTPAAEPVTVTLKLQLPLAASVPPLKLIALGAVVVTVPPQVLALPVATVIPAGNVSVKLIPVSPSDEFGFVIVNVKLVVPPTVTADAPNDFDSVGGEATVTVAVLLVVPVPPLVEVTAPVVLFFTPDVVPVTVTEN